MSEPVQMIWGESTFTRDDARRHRYGMHSAPWICDECDTRGWGDQFGPNEWARPHSRGHIPCPHCGKKLPVLMDGSARVHTRCPNRPPEVESVWLDAKDNLIVTRRTVAEGAPS